MKFSSILLIFGYIMSMDNGIERILPEPGESLAAAAVIASIFYPPIGVGVAVAGGMVSYLSRRQDEKRERAAKDAERAFNKAYSSWKETGRDLDDQEGDLVVEIITNALREDEEIKRELYYDPLICWMMRSHRPKEKVRAISNAIGQLSAADLYVFLTLHMTQSNSIRSLLGHIYGNDYAHEFVTSRFRALGLQRDEGKAVERKHTSYNLGNPSEVNQRVIPPIQVTTIGHDFIDAIRESNADLESYKIKIFGEDKKV